MKGTNLADELAGSPPFPSGFGLAEIERMTRDDELDGHGALAEVDHLPGLRADRGAIVIRSSMLRVPSKAAGVA